ncbi:MAG: hypothetical protein ACSLFM_01325 [Tepidiformaceae bacterium]
MGSPVTTTVREPGFTISREADYNLASIESAATRLKSWAVIMGVGLGGAPFVRLTSDLTAFVHLPIAREVDASEEDGISSGVIDTGDVIEVVSVPFDEMRNTAALLKGDLDSDWDFAGPIEFHADPEGFRSGSMRAPVIAKRVRVAA